jgi:transposase-like protein
MSDDTVVSFSDPAFRDELSELVQDGAQRIIKQAVETELQAFLDAHEAARDAQGRRAVVRNGYQPEREILTGIGTVKVKTPKTRDRAGEGRRFCSELLPPYLKKTRRLEAVIPWLYLKGVSTNDFDAALKGIGEGAVAGDDRAAEAELGNGVCRLAAAGLARARVPVPVGRWHLSERACG